MEAGGSRQAAQPLPINHPSAHNVYRKRTTVQKEVIELMTHAGARPVQILAAIQSEDQDTLVYATDIRGKRETIREKQLDRRSPIEALLDDISITNWVFAFKKDDNNRIQNLFFAYQKQVKLLLTNPDVLLTDCTLEPPTIALITRFCGVIVTNCLRKRCAT